MFVNGLVEQLNGFHFVLFNADDAFVGVDGFHQNLHAYQEFLRFLYEETEVASEIRLALCGINDYVFGFLAFGYHQFDVSGEGGAA